MAINPDGSHLMLFGKKKHGKTLKVHIKKYFLF